MSTKTVKYKLEGDSSGLKAAAAEGQKAFGQLADTATSKLGSMGNVLKAMGPMGTAAAVGIGATTAAATAAGVAIANMTKETAAWADGLAAAKDQTDLSFKSLQALELAADLGNTSLSALSGTTNKMQDAITNGSDAFRKLGLDIERLKQLRPEDQMRETAQAILSLGTAAERTTAMKDVFGKSGPEIIGALKAMASGAADLGGALSDEAMEAAAGLQDQLDLLDAAVDRVVHQFGAAVAQSPELQGAISDLTQLAADFAQTIAEATPKIVDFFNSIIAGAKAAKTALATGSLSAGVGQFFADAEEAGMREQMRKWANEVGFGTTGKGPLAAPGKPRYTGTGDDKAAEDAKKAAEKTRAAWQKASEEARKDWDKFYDGMHNRQGDMLEDQKKVIAQMAANHAAKVMQELNDQKEIEEAEKQIMADTARRQEEEAQAMHDAWMGVADALLNLGDVADGAFGTLIGLGGFAVGIFENLEHQAVTTAQKVAAVGNAINTAAGIMQGPGGAKGALHGAAAGAAAGAAFGGVGAIIGGVGGAILGLFGGPSDEEKRQQRQDAIDKTVKQLDDLQQKINALKMEKLQGGAAGVAALFSHLNDVTELTQDRFNNVGLFGAALFEEMRKQGMSTVQAFEAIRPALEEAAKVAEEKGLALEGTFGALAGFADKVSANQGLVDAVEAMGSVMDALSTNGLLNQDSANSAMAELNALFDEMTEAGFTATEQAALSAQALYDLKEAAEDGRITLDEETQAMVDLAEASGAFEGLEDPMEQMVELMKMQLEVVAALVEAIGGDLPESVRKYIDAINKVPNMPGITAGPDLSGGGGSIQGKYGGEDVIHAAKGYMNPSMGVGPLPGGGTPLVVHPGEAVSVTPAGSGFGGVTIHSSPSIVVQGAGNDREIVRAIEEALYNHESNLVARVNDIVTRG